MTACDLCGEERPVETLGFDHRDEPTPEDVWRVANVCRDCRDGRLLPTLRYLFQDGALNLNPPQDDGFETVDLPDGALFFAWDHPNTGTRHVAARVLTGPALGHGYVCVGACGISARAEPDARSTLLSARKEGVIVCARCIRARPHYVAGEAVA